jgi:hypothetical protein
MQSLDALHAKVQEASALIEKNEQQQNAQWI